jgi:hypothetical protein
LLSVDESDGLNTAMNAMLTLVKDPDHRKRRIANSHLANFLSGAELDISRYYPDLIRVFLMSFDDTDKAVVQAAWTAQNELTKRLNKEDMDELVIPTRQILLQVGVAGSNLPGFELPKGINAILPIFLQGLMYGSTEQRTAAALALSDVMDRASVDALKPFVTQITGPLIRVVSERSVEVKCKQHTVNIRRANSPSCHLIDDEQSSREDASVTETILPTTTENLCQSVG